MPNDVDKLAAPVDNLDPKSVWDRCLGIIRENVNPQSYQTWFLPIVPISLNGSIMTIQVPSQFFYEWLEEHYPHIIRSALTQVIGEGSAPAYTVFRKTDDGGPRPITNINKPTGVYMGDETHLHSRYTFDNFVEGRI